MTNDDWDIAEYESEIERLDLEMRQAVAAKDYTLLDKLIAESDRLVLEGELPVPTTEDKPQKPSTESTPVVEQDLSQLSAREALRQYLDGKQPLKQPQKPVKPTDKTVQDLVKELEVAEEELAEMKKSDSPPSVIGLFERAITRIERQIQAKGGRTWPRSGSTGAFKEYLDSKGVK